MRKIRDDRDTKIARLERELAEALASLSAAEAVITDQRARLKGIGTTLEEHVRKLAATKSELQRVARERDLLKLDIAGGDDAHAATVALPEGYANESVYYGTSLPSLEELMAALGDASEASTQVRQPPPEQVEEPQEMLSPEVVFPEQYGAAAQSATGAGCAKRLLVLLDAEKPVTYPLDKEDMTIGRGDSADIRIDSHFISRIHARLVATPDGVVVEDVASKNGIVVNSQPAKRQALRHGDLISFGGLRFRYLDTSCAEA